MEKVRSRDWDKDQVALLVGQGKREVQPARRERIPLDDDADSDEDDVEVLMIVERAVLAMEPEGAGVDVG